ncbi:chitobiase/beta-hexosaminidase C-terminal domain-containing protein, partial [Clostridioides difficile]|uniref:chitobiase/beta-hexosaminidase C-terminal domain-containing protein n=1 Tax=Clostridioides difficile TaxID=1496 RepID=UPI002ED3283A
MQTVTISTATSGAEIHFTEDGTTPTAQSPLYSAPLTVSATETINAIATLAGAPDSAVATATLTI